ncbi:Amino-acid transporter arg-13 [Trichoderma virens FT-333]|nr:Amino-acid transporter arg-13 [Trichoderma virens FT-333]
MDAVEDIIYGSVAGIAGKYIEYPFDTVKVRLQSQPDHLPLRYTGPLDCFRQSIKSDGFRGLYRGISAPLFGAAAETSSLFLFESVGRELLYKANMASRDKEMSLPLLWLTGAISGVFTSFVLTPIELVKCKIQVPALSEGAAVTHLRPLAVIREVYRHEGIRGFWHGQVGTLIREAGGCSAWFGAKETVTKAFYRLRLRSATSEAERETIRSKPLPLWQQAIAGASGAFHTTFCSSLPTPSSLACKRRLWVLPNSAETFGARAWPYGGTTDCEDCIVGVASPAPGQHLALHSFSLYMTD